MSRYNFNRSMKDHRVYFDRESIFHESISAKKIIAWKNAYIGNYVRHAGYFTCAVGLALGFAVLGFCQLTQQKQPLSVDVDRTNAAWRWTSYKMFSRHQERGPYNTLFNCWKSDPYCGYDQQ